MVDVTMLTTSSVRFFFFQAEDGIRDDLVTGVQTCALPICLPVLAPRAQVNRPFHTATGSPVRTGSDRCGSGMDYLYTRQYNCLRFEFRPSLSVCHRREDAEVPSAATGA